MMLRGRGKRGIKACAEVERGLRGKGAVGGGANNSLPMSKSYTVELS